MPSQLVKCAFGFRSFNDPKSKCVPLSVELGSEQRARASGAPPHGAGPGTVCTLYSITIISLYNVHCTVLL